MQDDMRPVRMRANPRTGIWQVLRAIKDRRQSLFLGALIVFQGLCWVVLVVDISGEIQENWPRIWGRATLVPELLATIGLFFAIIFEAWVLIRMTRRQAGLEKGLRVAAGALGQVIEEYFLQWGLTPAEQDIAAFTIKGYSIAEIATLRGSAGGTVKTHLNAIYRKAKVTGRAQLVSLLIEDLMRAPLTPLRAPA